jgi:hypothetical protein
MTQALVLLPSNLRISGFSSQIHRWRQMYYELLESLNLAFHCCLSPSPHQSFSQPQGSPVTITTVGLFLLQSALVSMGLCLFGFWV